MKYQFIFFYLFVSHEHYGGKDFHVMSSLWIWKVERVKFQCNMFYQLLLWLTRLYDYMLLSPHWNAERAVELAVIWDSNMLMLRCCNVLSDWKSKIWIPLLRDIPTSDGETTYRMATVDADNGLCQGSTGWVMMFFEGVSCNTCHMAKEWA